MLVDIILIDITVDVLVEVIDIKYGAEVSLLLWIALVDATVGEFVKVPENEVVISLFDAVVVDVTNGVKVSSLIDTALVDITDDTEADVLLKMYTVLVG